MRHLKRNLIACLSAVSVFVIIGISCSDNNPDPMLWKEQSNERIIFMSMADSPEGELYLLDKSGQISRLTNNNRHENNPAT